MKAQQFQELLVRLNTCKDARVWAEGKTWRQVYDTCERGDWLMWLFEKTNPDDKRLKVLVGGHIANTVRHLMTDERSRNAVDVCIRYGIGEATDNELTAARVAVRDAARAAAWDAAWDAAGAARVAKVASLKQSADIVRKYIPIEKFNI